MNAGEGATPAAKELAGRILAFERELERRCATHVEPTRFGTAYLNLDAPLRYDSNFVWVDRQLEGVDALALAADADRVLGAHDLAHRQLRVDDDRHGPRFGVVFLELGWSVERLVTMAQVREPERRGATGGPAVAVAEVGLAEARPFLEAVLRSRTDAGGGGDRDGDEVVAQLVDVRERFEREAGARFFVAEVDGSAASGCELYAIDGVAQIEDVNTLEEHRGRGLASAVVLAAADAARARACEVVFLVADETDWPKELYARLGFEPVARSWSFLRPPS